MPEYKHRRIELIPRRHANGTWQCPYTIIEFRPTCWAYHKGCPDGNFPSRHEAAMAALKEAKRLVDALEPPPHGVRFVRSKSRALLTTITIFVRSALARRERKPT